MARAIHHASPRRAHRFIAINCSAIPENLLEAELFGHTRGAFTGAVGTRQGKLEQAHRGTLFLDEVGTMSMALQMKLLRVLQEREFERVGDSQTIKVDVRVIAATNADLAKMVADGSFREDLFYRLNVIPVRLPALRERKEDIPLLVQHFLQKFGAELNRPTLTVSQSALRCLMTYQWPGNVRQLENAMERAVALSGGRPQVELSDLPPDIQRASEGEPFLYGLALPDDGIDFEIFIARIEREVIRKALERTGGNKAAAAQVLNLKRTTLVEKLKRLDGSSPDAAAPRVLDDSDWRRADRVPRARPRRPRAHVRAAAAETARRHDEVLRARPAVGIAGRSAPRHGAARAAGYARARVATGWLASRSARPIQAEEGQAAVRRTATRTAARRAPRPGAQKPRQEHRAETP